jgi:hypothetical protein
LDAERARRLLSPRGHAMLELRTVGFDWNEIAEVLKTTDGAARLEYSRELKRAKLKMQASHKPGKGPSLGCH